MADLNKIFAQFSEPTSPDFNPTLQAPNPTLQAPKQIAQPQGNSYLNAIGSTLGSGLNVLLNPLKQGELLFGVGKQMYNHIKDVAGGAISDRFTGREFKMYQDAFTNIKYTALNVSAYLNKQATDWATKQYGQNNPITKQFQNEYNANINSINKVRSDAQKNNQVLIENPHDLPKFFSQTAQFNAQQDNAMQQFYAQNQLVIDQSNAQWRRDVNTANTAAANTVYTQGVDVSQNTYIQAAFDKANTSSQNTFSTISVVGSNTVSANSSTDTLSFVGESGISLSMNTENKTISVSPNTINMNYINQFDYDGLHRSGWSYVLHNLKYKQSINGIICDFYVDRTFHWNNNILKQLKIIPYTSPWIGFIHHTMDENYTDYNTSNLFKNKLFTESLKHCKGLIVLSNYLREQIINYIAKLNISVKVYSLVHPTEFISNDKLFHWSDVKEYLTRAKDYTCQNGWGLTTIHLGFYRPHIKIMEVMNFSGSDYNYFLKYITKPEFIDDNKICEISFIFDMLK